MSLNGTQGTFQWTGRSSLYLRTIFVPNFNYFDHTCRYLRDLFTGLITHSGMWNFPWTNITFKWTKSFAILRRIFVYETVLRLSEGDSVTYRVIGNDCRGFNNLLYAIHLR